MERGKRLRAACGLTSQIYFLRQPALRGLHKPGAETPIPGLWRVRIDVGGGAGMGVHQSLDSALRVAHCVHQRIPI